MPTFNRRSFVVHALRYFLRQDYPRRELIVIDDGTDVVEDLIPSARNIRYIRLPRRATVGAKRNLACQQARGEIIAHWDDDDWAAPWRLSYQIAELQTSNAMICGLDRIFYYEPKNWRAWEYVNSQSASLWVSGNSLCYHKRFWQAHPFADINIAEDARFVCQARRGEIQRLANAHFLVGFIHDSNASPKRLSSRCWRVRPAEQIQQLMGDDVALYHAESRGTGRLRLSALVTAARGLGDILRVTPMIRVLHRLGYDVDVLIEPDYVESVELLAGAPEIRQLFYRSRARNGPPIARLDGLAANHYDVAMFTTWSQPLVSLCKAARKFVFDRVAWLRQGDSQCIGRIARELGWQYALPSPFAMAGERRFDIEPGTIAIHPGCKPDWPWKKWHGFDELAARLERAVLVGTADDLDNSGTYFPRAFRWPAHIRSYIGLLSLRDTAALLSQCAALVSNDSGLMHLGVALGIPTFGIFGITSPSRESIPADNMFAITKALPCEPKCRCRPWGSRNCEHNLACLRQLTADEVVARVSTALSNGA
jgi:ADP-heptose:LPS heptosyltransferase